MATQITEEDVVITDTTVISTRVVERVDEPAAPLKRHAVWKEDNRHMVHIFHDWSAVTGADIIDVARVRGIEIVARCGHTWVPQMTNPTGLETCDTCIDIMSKQEFDD